MCSWPTLATAERPDWGRPTRPPTPPLPSALVGEAVTGDVNGDDVSDLVVANSGDGNVALLLGAADGLRLAEPLPSPGLHPTALAEPVAGPNVPGVYVADAGSETAFLLSFSVSTD